MQTLLAAMAKSFSDDVLIPSAAADGMAGSRPFAAFIPIGVAIAGIAAILLGGISAQNPIAAGPADIDTIVTGSVAKASAPAAAEVGHAR
jgi:hypothetical protein